MAKYTNIGGQALLEGIMMRGPERTAMAVRNREGRIRIEQFETISNKNRPKICRLPVIRGVFGLIDSLRIGYKCLMRSADLSGLAEEEENAFAQGLPDWDLVPPQLAVRRRRSV